MNKITNVSSIYIFMINHKDVFFKILEEMEEGKTNYINEKIYNEILDNYVELRFQNSYKIKNEILNTLSLDNLYNNNLINYERGSNSNIVFMDHVLDIFRNIYKEFSKSMKTPDFIDRTNYMMNKKKYFKTVTHHSTELEENVESFKNKLLEINNNIVTTIHKLEYEKNNFVQTKTNNENKFKISKLKKAKELRNRLITPLLNFINFKEQFMKEYEELIQILEEKNINIIRNNLKDIIMTKTIIVLNNTQIKEIRKYINKYISQTEKDLQVNLALEKMFNEIEEVSEEYKTTSLKNRYFLNDKNLINKNLYFYNSRKFNKSFNLNSQKENIEHKISHIIKEELKNTLTKEKQKLIHKKQTEKEKVIQEKMIKRKQLENNLLKDFKVFYKNDKTKNINDLIYYIYNFLESSKYKENYIGGDISTLYYHSIRELKNDKKNTIINKKEKKVIKLKNHLIKYIQIEIKKG